MSLIRKISWQRNIFFDDRNKLVSALDEIYLCITKNLRRLKISGKVNVKQCELENVAENMIFLNGSSNTTVERDATQLYVWSICCFREMINGISLTIIFIFLLMTLNRKNVKSSVLAVRFHRNFWKNFYGKSAVSECYW